MNQQPGPNEADRERILAQYFKVPSIKGDNRQLIKRFLLGALWSAVLTPLIFYLRFGEIDSFAIGFTIFLVVLCLLFALGFYFQTKTQYHTQVEMRGTFADRIGAFWLVACAFGPFIGWIITVVGVTETSWRCQYLSRVFFAVVLPIITAVPLVPYARGRAVLVAIPLLLIVTVLPISSCLWVLADLHDGAQTMRVAVVTDGPDGPRTCRDLDSGTGDFRCKEFYPAAAGQSLKVTWLKHTRRVLAKERLTR